MARVTEIARDEGLNCAIATFFFPPALGGLETYLERLATAVHERASVAVLAPVCPEDEAIDRELPFRVLRRPMFAGWIAQRPVSLSTSPTLVGERVAPRHIDLRPYAVNDGGDVWLLPGGLTRVALPEGTLVVNSSQGGGSKDTWVLAAEPLTAPRARTVSTALPEVVPHDVSQRDAGPPAGAQGQQQ